MSARARNNVRTMGYGVRPILFAHGFGCDQTMWRYVAPAFEADHRVVLFDHVGSGRSDLSWEDTMRVDIHYVENWSLTFDFMIIWKTFGAVLRGSGAY